MIEQRFHGRTSVPPSLQQRRGAQKSQADAPLRIISKNLKNTGQQTTPVICRLHAVRSLTRWL